jgi:hypothetical protein
MTKPMGDKRTFTIVSSSFGLTGGRFVSENPMDAGKKAGKRLFARTDKGNSNQVSFEMKEITRTKKVSHSKEKYFYQVTRSKIPENKRKVQKYKNKTDGTISQFTPMYEYKAVAVEGSAVGQRGGEGLDGDGLMGSIGSFMHKVIN